MKELESNTDRYDRRYKDLKPQTDLSDFNFVSYCSLSHHTKLGAYFPENNPILDILLACIKQSKVLDKAALRFKTPQKDLYSNKKQEGVKE